jgi:hypothetical protein
MMSIGPSRFRAHPPLPNLYRPKNARRQTTVLTYPSPLTPILSARLVAKAVLLQESAQLAILLLTPGAPPFTPLLPCSG